MTTLTDIISVKEAGRSAVKTCPQCGWDIKAGGDGSGCNPEVGKCGRPKGSGNKDGTKENPTGKRQRTRPKPKPVANPYRDDKGRFAKRDVQRAIDNEPHKAETGESYVTAEKESFSIMNPDTAKMILKEGAIITAQIMFFIVLEQFLIAPALIRLGWGATKAMKWAGVGARAKSAQRLLFAGDKGIPDTYAVVVWRKGTRYVPAKRAKVGWRDKDIGPEMVDRVEFFRRGEDEPYEVIKNEVKK